VAPANNVNFSISVGTRIPRDVSYHPLPAEVVTIYPEWRGYEFILVNDQIVVEVYVALEYGLRMSEIAHNIMSSVKFSIEKMLGVPVLQVNVNIQGLAHSTASETR